jgi:hypothetical protein
MAFLSTYFIFAILRRRPNNYIVWVTVWLLIYLVFADWLIGPGQKSGRLSNYTAKPSRRYFRPPAMQACPFWMHTQSNITNIIFTWVYITPTNKKCHSIIVSWFQRTFPPHIYYKIFTHRNVVDMCANSSKNYTKASTKQLVPRQYHNKEYINTEQGIIWLIVRAIAWVLETLRF